MKVAKKKARKPTPDEVDNMGGNLHTALRKCCDSKATSAAWNIIHVLDQRVWRSFLAAMVGATKGSELHTRFERWDNMMADDGAWSVEQVLGEEEAHDARHISMTFRCILNCFDLDDWDGMAGFLVDND